MNGFLHDIRIYLYTENMNEKQKAAFIECIEKINAYGWIWDRSFIDGTYRIENGNSETLGQGVSLAHALEEAEGAK